MADATSPSLSSFAVSLGTGVLTINFNEPVNASTLVITELVFKSRGDGSALASQVHTLTGGLLMTRTNALQLVVNLTTADLNAIKAKPSLLEDMSSTFVGISPLFVEDMYGNALNAEVAKAGLFDPDQTKPILLSFGVDMNQHILSLTFDETMNATSLVPAGLVLQLSSSAGAPGRHRLTGGTLLATLPSTVVQLSLLESDVDAIKAKSIALSVASTWLAMDAGSVAEMVGINPLALVDSTNARQVVSDGSFAPDTTPPTLCAFILSTTQS